MDKKTNIHFNIKMKVDGKDRAVEMGMTLGELEKVMKKVDKASAKTSGAIASMMTTLEYSINAAQRLNSVVSDLAAAYSVQQQAETQLAQSMRNSWDATDEQIQKIKDLTSAQQAVGVVGDEVQLAGAKQLATYLSLQGSLEALIPLMNDMATHTYGYNVSAQQAQGVADALGKALMGQDRALKSYGISLTDAQKELLKTGTETERVALLQELLSAKVGGSNEALRQTASGGVQAMANTLGDWKEKLGEMVAAYQPIINAASSWGMVVLSVIQLAQALKLTTAATKLYHVAANLVKTDWLVSNKAIYRYNLSLGMTTTAARAATVATSVLGGVIKSLLITTGVGAAIWALGEAINYLTGQSDDAEVELSSVSSAIDALRNASAQAQGHMDGQAAALKKLMDSGADTSEAVRGLNAEYGNMFGQMKTAAEWYDTLISKSGDYAKAMGYQAQIQSLYASLAATRMEMDYQKREEVKGRTGKKYNGRHIHTKEGEKALERYNALVVEEQKIWSMIQSGEAELDRIGLDLSSLGPEWHPNTPEVNAPKGTPTVEPVIPEGSLKDIQKKISDIREKIELAVDDQSRIDLNAQLAALEKEKRTIEFRYKFPNLTKENLQAVADHIASTIPPLQLKLDSPQLPTTVGQDIKDNLDEVTNEDSQSALQQTVKGLNDIGGAMQSLSKITGEGASAWLSYAGNVVNAVGQALPALQTLFAANTATAASGTVAQNASVGPWGWIAGIAAMASVLAALASLPKFAEGGIAYGPTVGLFGEYPGAANNPEVVAPLSKLESIIEPRGIDPKTFRFVLRGRTLVAAEEKEARYISKR